MALPHITVAKAAVLTVNVAAAVWFMADPTVKVAIIAGVALVASNVPALIIALLNNRAMKQVHQATKEMSINVDGNLKRLLDERVTESVKLGDVQQSLARAEGHREGVEGERERTP